MQWHAKPKTTDHDWHRWFAWRPVRTHNYFYDGKLPHGEPTIWVWLEMLWRIRVTPNWAADTTTYHVK